MKLTLTSFEYYDFILEQIEKAPENSFRKRVSMYSARCSQSIESRPRCSAKDAGVILRNMKYKRKHWRKGD
jgi:hypothetical protein